MKELLVFIKSNINWIKDTFTIVFVGTATIISILTYKRARATILQPIRNEVIKKQSELLSSLLNFIKNKNQSFESGVDYVNLVPVNVIKTIKDYGFVLNDDKLTIEWLEQKVVEFIPCGKSKILKDIENYWNLSFRK